MCSSDLTNGQFAELGDTVYGADFFKATRHPATSASASAGWSSDKLGSFSLSYIHSHTEGSPADGIGSFGWSRSFKKSASLYAGANKNFRNRRELSFHAGLSVSLDNGYSTSAGISRNKHNNSYQATLNKISSGMGSTSWGIGWQQNDNTNGSRSNTLNGNIRHQNTYGDGWANVYSQSGNSSREIGRASCRERV